MSEIITRRCDSCRTIFRDRGQTECPRCGTALDRQQTAPYAVETLIPNEAVSQHTPPAPPPEPVVEMPLPQAPPSDPVEAVYEVPPAFAPPATAADVRSSRPWYRKKRYIVLVGLHAVIAVAFFASGGEGGNPSPTANPEQGAPQQRLFPGRPDAQPEDQEREIGQSARIGDLEAVVNEAGFQQSVSEFESDGYAVAVVNISNVGTGPGTEAYDPLQWRLQLPSGQVLDAENPTLADSLGSGDLIGGSSVSGRVAFRVKDQRGDLYILYKPNPLDAARGVWKVTI